MESPPSPARTIVAVVIYLLAGAVAMAWKLSRASMGGVEWLPGWLPGVMPNLLPAMVLPMLLFATKRSVRWSEYVNTVGAMLGGLCLYEIIQLWMPKRTFDWADLAASVGGALVGCVMGWLVFFRGFGSERPGPSGSRLG